MNNANNLAFGVLRLFTDSIIVFFETFKAYKKRHISSYKAG